MAYDVLTKGGRVINPASKTYRPLDLAIQGGRIAKVAADIDASEAAPWVDARGKLVVPGLMRRRTGQPSCHLRLWHLFTSWL